MAAPFALTEPPAAALIGGGFIGPVHAEALRRIGVPVIGLLGSAPERAQPLADRLRIPRVYRDFDQLLGDPEVQVVHIASPNGAHYEQARRLLDSGRHVVCEKPLATNSTETASLAQLSVQRPAQAAAVNYNIRYYPIAREMRARVARGDLGRVLSVTGSYTQDWLLYPTDFNWRVEPDGGANLRAVADIGTHWMDLAQHVVFTPIRSVLADLAIFHPERRRPTGPTDTFGGSAGGVGSTVPVAVETEDFGAILLRFSGEIRGAFHVSQAFAGRKNRLVLEVAGTDASLSWDSESPEILEIGRRGRPNERLLRDPSLFTPEVASGSHYPGGHAEGFPDSFKFLFLSVYDWMASRGLTACDFPTFADGHREVVLCEAIAQSAREGRWVEVNLPAVGDFPTLDTIPPSPAPPRSR